MLNENGKLLMGFTEYNKLALLNAFFYTPKVACPIHSKAPTVTTGDKHVGTIS